MMGSNGEGKARSSEAQLVMELRALLAGKQSDSVFTVAPSSDLCYSLELFIPKVLRRYHSEWAEESLDGIFVSRARKSGPFGVELVGTCILISDQTMTPLLVELEAAALDELIVRFRVCLGEPGGGHLGISGPVCGTREAEELLASVTNRVENIEWAYQISNDGR